MPAEKDPRPKIGTVDDLEVYLGQRGTGKSTAMVARARALRNKFGGAYVIGHSLGRRLPSQLPAELGGHKLPIRYHTTLQKLAKALRDKPDEWHILAPPLALEMPRDYYDKIERQTADDLLRFSVQLSTAIRIAAYRKQHPLSITRDVSRLDFDGLPATPIIVLVDEGVAVESAGQSKSNPLRQEFLEYIFSLRHLHIALLWSIQDPTARGWNIMGQATWLHVFHIKHEYALQAVRAAGGSEDDLEKIANQYAYESVAIRVKVRSRAEVPEKIPSAPPAELPAQGVKPDVAKT